MSLHLRRTAVSFLVRILSEHQLKVSLLLSVSSMLEVLAKLVLQSLVRILLPLLSKALRFLLRPMSLVECKARQELPSRARSVSLLCPEILLIRLVSQLVLLCLVQHLSWAVATLFRALPVQVLLLSLAHLALAQAAWRRLDQVLECLSVWCPLLEALLP